MPAGQPQRGKLEGLTPCVTPGATSSNTCLLVACQRRCHSCTACMGSRQSWCKCKLALQGCTACSLYHCLISSCLMGVASQIRQNGHGRDTKNIGLSREVCCWRVRDCCGRRGDTGRSRSPVQCAAPYCLLARSIPQRKVNMTADGVRRSGVIACQKCCVVHRRCINAHGTSLSASWLHAAMLHLDSLKAPPRSYACPDAGT